jgi:hypothetical protein
MMHEADESVGAYVVAYRYVCVCIVCIVCMYTYMYMYIYIYIYTFYIHTYAHTHTHTGSIIKDLLRPKEWPEDTVSHTCTSMTYAYI